MKSGKTPGGNSNRIKDPDDWVTGDEEMTGAQESYFETLAEEAHEPAAAELTKAEASKEIDRLQTKPAAGANPRGREPPLTGESNAGLRLSRGTFLGIVLLASGLVGLPEKYPGWT